jgi:hypothetical protein
VGAKKNKRKKETNMENKLGMVGAGRVQGGVMVFADATGKGFAKKISSPVVRREPAVVSEVIVAPVLAETKKAKEVDVPAFMKNRKPAKKETNNVVPFPTKGGDVKKEWTADDIEEAFTNVVNKVTNKIESTRVFKFFFGEGEDRY